MFQLGRTCVGPPRRRSAARGTEPGETGVDPTSKLAESAPFGLSHRAALGWCVALVAIGLVVRFVRYALRFPLWHDELMLTANLLDRRYEDLLVPLSLKQVAPFGFLWIERFLIETWGFHEWSLRLFPTVCGAVGLLVFGTLAWRALVVKGMPHGSTPSAPQQIDRLAAVLAIGVLAVAYYPLGTRARSNRMPSTSAWGRCAVPWRVEWLKRPERTGWLWGLAVATPVAMWVSYPAAFVAGGTALALLPGVLRRASASTVSAYCAFGVLMLGAFAIVTGMGGLGKSSGPERRYVADLVSHVSAADQPAGICRMGVSVHTGEFLAYPVGGENGASVVSTVLAGLGAWWLWRRSTSVAARPLVWRRSRRSAYCSWRRSCTSTRTEVIRGWCNSWRPI